MEMDLDEAAFWITQASGISEREKVEINAQT
jgi:hypothetical protein